jgi:peptide/nickel transport system substrate-binding protein
MRLGSALRRVGSVVVALSIGALCLVQGVPAGAASHSQRSGEVTFAGTGPGPTYLFPLYDGAEAGNNNITLVQPLMWLPLYWFGSNTNPKIEVNYTLSMAGPPSFSNGNKTITVDLKHYVWSTGAPVTARDLVFWMNIMLNNKTNYSNYYPGGWMTHVVSYSAPSPSTFVLDLGLTYNKTYLVDDVLSILTPIPQQAWDKTSASSPVGNYDETAAGAKRVYDFLNAASRSKPTFATNPVWQVVDGPWRIKPGTGFQVTGQITFVPNQRYSGPNKAKVGEFEELPFTSDSAEFNALRAGTLDYGYVPLNDIAEIAAVKASGFTIKPWYAWGIAFVTINYSNPKYGPIVSQLYIRQAMQMLIDQPEYIKSILGGYGYPTYGPVPSYPKSQYLSPALKKNPYPYDPAKALRLVETHGWTISNGVATCTRPGTGPKECGKGIRAHTPLQIPLSYVSGSPSIAEEVQTMQTAFKAAGIRLMLKEGSTTTVNNALYDCTGKPPSKCPASSPVLSYLGSPYFTFVPTYYPSGNTVFGCGGSTNAGNYCNPQVQALLDKVIHEGTAAATKTIHQLDLLLAKQLPVLWMPNEPEQISAISNKLGGVESQDPSVYIYPSTWTLKP